MKRAMRRALVEVKVEEDSDTAKAKMRKRKVPSPRSPFANNFDKHEDGKCSRSRATTSKLLTLAELSILSEERGRTRAKRDPVPEKRAIVGAQASRKGLGSKAQSRSNKQRASG
ncbi:MAG: hypothetical protein Q9225_005567 [Loekoesia sp. 1 TL-2023]